MIDMVVKELIKTYDNGALSIKYEKDAEDATLGGIRITKEQAENLCKNFGWTEIYLSPFEIIDKTQKFVRALKKNVADDLGTGMIDVTFQNKRSNTYGKTYDRIHFESPKDKGVSVLYGMAGNESPYVIYDSQTSVPVRKCRNLKQVIEYINERF